MTSDHDNLELHHHGIKGQRWGVRRYQNKDGSLTPAGEKRQARLDARRQADDLKAKRAKRKLDEKKAKQDMKEDKLDRENARKIAAKNAKVGRDAARAEIRSKNRGDDLYDLPDDGSIGSSERSFKVGKGLVIGALAVVGISAAAYAYKKFKIDPKKAADVSKDAVDKLKSDVLKLDPNNPGSYLFGKKLASKIEKAPVKDLGPSANTIERLKKLREQSAQKKAAAEAAAKNKYTANAIDRLKKLRKQGVAKKAAEAAAKNKYTANTIERLRKLRKDGQQKKFEKVFAPVLAQEQLKTQLKERRYSKLFDQAEAKERTASGQRIVNSLSALLQTRVSAQNTPANSSSGTSISSKAKTGASVTLSVLEALKNRKAP